MWGVWPRLLGFKFDNELSLQVTIKTNLLAELKHNATFDLSNSSLIYACITVFDGRQ